MKRRQGVSGTSLKVSSVFHPLLPSASSSWATGILPYRSALESTNSETDLSLSRKKAASTCNFMGWWKKSKQGWLDIKSPGQVTTGWSFLCLSKQSLCIPTEIDFIILEHLKAAWDCTEWFGDFSDTGEGSETFCWQVIACLVGIIRLVACWWSFAASQQGGVRVRVCLNKYFLFAVLTISHHDPKNYATALLNKNYIKKKEREKLRTDTKIWPWNFEANYKLNLEHAVL